MTPLLARVLNRKYDMDKPDDMLELVEDSKLLILEVERLQKIAENFVLYMAAVCEKNNSKYHIPLSALERLRKIENFGLGITFEDGDFIFALRGGSL